MEVSNCLKRPNAVGSRKLGCQVTMKTKLIQLSSGQTVLEIRIPSLKAHLATKGGGTTGARGAIAPLKFAEGGLSPPYVMAR